MARVTETRDHKVFAAERQGTALIVLPQGDAIGFRESDLQKELDTLLRLLKDPELDLVVDLSRSNYFGTVILGAINELGLRVRARGGRTALCCVSEAMREILGVMHLDELWASYETRKEALRALRKPR
ncbi:MAG: STAS domain-containing protein [Planctomycetales bacterium]